MAMAMDNLVARTRRERRRSLRSTSASDESRISSASSTHSQRWAGAAAVAADSDDWIDPDASSDGAELSQMEADIMATYDLTDKHAVYHPEDYQTFKTRPDLQVPRWNVTVERPQDIAPGYWFTTPYEIKYLPAPQASWNGPHIFDNRGELVWSGAHLCDNSDCNDFRIQMIHGLPHFVFLYRGKRKAVIVDRTYSVVRAVSVAKGTKDYNAHELNIIDDGNRVLALFKHGASATREDSRSVGYSGQCGAAFDGFREYDYNTENWDPVFEWNSQGNIGLNESTKGLNGIKSSCDHHWDYVHLNSVDKCPDGDYLLSARHTDTIYKIDKDDGSIKYRIGGVASDFKGDFKFSRQHHIRCLDQNRTHLTMSMMDNAKDDRQDEGTNPYSRGLVVTLDMASRSHPKPMYIAAEYPHPDLGYTPSRGSLSYLPGGNAFLSWTVGSKISEHLADGTLVMQASMVTDYLTNYRAYKYDFVGEPTEWPVVYAEQVIDREHTDFLGHPKAVTRVYVSWNGATEVASWTIKSIASSGKHGNDIASGPRTGFETMIQYNDTIDAGYVRAEARDRDGRVLRYGWSKVTPIRIGQAGGHHGPPHGAVGGAPSAWPVLRACALAFVAGLLFALLLRTLWPLVSQWSDQAFGWWRSHAYTRVASHETSELSVSETKEDGKESMDGGHEAGDDRRLEDIKLQEHL